MSPKKSVGYGTEEHAMSVIEWKKDESAAIIVMNNGENRQNPAFVQGMKAVLDEIEKDTTITSAVITSGDPKHWSQGFDVPWVTETLAKNEPDAVRDFIRSMDAVFKRMLTFPMPLIAAINGHAAANGANLACACDFRFMRGDRGFFFYPEVDIDIPLMPGLMAICKKAIPLYKLDEMFLSGKRYTARDLEEHHIFVKVTENEETLMSEALAFAKSFRKKRPIFAEMKRRMNRGVIEVIETQNIPHIEKLDLMTTG
jgi:enoyl-CoA hydratase/carnithine racemase